MLQTIVRPFILTRWQRGSTMLSWGIGWTCTTTCLKVLKANVARLLRQENLKSTIWPLKGFSAELWDWNSEYCIVFLEALGTIKIRPRSLFWCLTHVVAQSRNHPPITLVSRQVRWIWFLLGMVHFIVVKPARWIRAQCFPAHSSPSS